MLAPDAAPAASSEAAGAPSPVSTTTDAEPNGQDDAIGNELIEHHRHHHHGGIVRFVAMSLDTIGVAPERQTEIVKIQATLHADLEPSRTADAKVLLLLADGVAVGKVDSGKLDAAIARLARASATVRAATADTLNELHAVLSPAERTALVGKIEAHWQVWQHANEAHARQGEGPQAHGGGAPLDRLTRELSLSPDQVEKIRAALSTGTPAAHPPWDPEKSESHLRAFAAAFEEPSFDAKKLDTAHAPAAAMATWGATRMVRFYTAIVPVLIPEQRSTLAQRLRERANDVNAKTSG